MNANEAMARDAGWDWDRDADEYCGFCLSMYCRDLELHCAGCDVPVCAFCAEWLQEAQAEAHCPPCATHSEGY